jgi:hypothetical protein
LATKHPQKAIRVLQIREAYLCAKCVESIGTKAFQAFFYAYEGKN